MNHKEFEIVKDKVNTLSDAEFAEVIKGYMEFKIRTTSKFEVLKSITFCLGSVQNLIQKHGL